MYTVLVVTTMSFLNFNILCPITFLTSNNILSFTQINLHASCRTTVPILANITVGSVCSGRSETEMSSQDLCVCPDKNKAALLSGAFASKYLFRYKSNVIFHYHDMMTGLLRLLRKIRAETRLPVSVLFQHPYPSQNSSRH